jgi:phage gp36-like protein
MPYAVKQDLIDRYALTELIQLTDRSGAVDAIDDGVLNQALLDTDAEIDSYLMGRYKLPLASTPKVLISVACDIARYRLYDDRATDQVSKRYDDAVKLLTKIAKGEISLGIDGSAQPTPTGGGPTSFGDGRTFSSGLLADF